MSEPIHTARSNASELQRINACAKRPIDVWTNFVCYPLSIRLVYVVRTWRVVTPNSITLFSLLLALAGCAFYAVGQRGDVVTGLVLVQVSYVFDCADGQLARYRKQYSPIGGWLDQIADRFKEFAIYFSLAWGFTRFHPGQSRIWAWAMLALFTLYVLEYYGQVTMFRTPASSPATDAVQAAAATGDPAPDAFARAQRLRAFVPFHGFIIGEQYFVQLVFIAFGAIYPMFIFVGLLGLLMCIYRPVVQAVKYRRALKEAG